jgi:hypothetical protein
MSYAWRLSGRSPPLVVGRTLESITADFAGFWRQLTSDSQLRWLGPERPMAKRESLQRNIPSHEKYSH